MILAGSILAAGFSIVAGEQNSPRDRRESVPTVEAALLKIPRGQLPRTGECRIWNPDRPPSSQRPPGQCSALIHEVPPGSWLVERPIWDRERFRVAVFHPTRPGVEIAVRLYEADSRLYVGEEERR
jgi:hypothetical protein